MPHLNNKGGAEDGALPFDTLANTVRVMTEVTLTFSDHAGNLDMLVHDVNVIIGIKVSCQGSKSQGWEQGILYGPEKAFGPSSK